MRAASCWWWWWEVNALWVRMPYERGALAGDIHFFSRFPCAVYGYSLLMRLLRLCALLCTLTCSFCSPSTAFTSDTPKLQLSCTHSLHPLSFTLSSCRNGRAHQQAGEAQRAQDRLPHAHPAGEAARLEIGRRPNTHTYWEGERERERKEKRTMVEREDKTAAAQG